MKMIGKLNEKDLKINKKQMILWMGGILAAVILLMVFIVKVEPPAEGISRAEAAKALALVFEDPQTLEDMASERENSSFTDKEKGNWFVKYMDYLYEKGYLDTEITPATLTSAQGNLTYEDVNTVAEKLSSGLEKQVGMTRGNKKKTFSRNDWWELYKAIVKETDKDGNMKEVSAVCLAHLLIWNRPKAGLLIQQKVPLAFRDWLWTHILTARSVSGPEARKWQV